MIMVVPLTMGLSRCVCQTPDSSMTRTGRCQRVPPARPRAADQAELAHGQPWLLILAADRHVVLMRRHEAAPAKGAGAARMLDCSGSRVPPQGPGSLRA